MKSEDAGNEIVTLDIGFDRFQAELILARCRSERIDAHFLSMDDNGLAPGLIAMAPNKILVKRRDAARVQAIADRIRISSEPRPSADRSPGWLASILARLPWWRVESERPAG